MLCLSGFELCSSWVPLLYAECSLLIPDSYRTSTKTIPNGAFRFTHKNG